MRVATYYYEGFEYDVYKGKGEGDTLYYVYNGYGNTDIDDKVYDHLPTYDEVVKYHKAIPNTET